MMPVGPLMTEHRLIERMVVRMEAASQDIRRTEKVDGSFIQVAVDFLRTYADRCHHGKEEDLLFKALKTKKLSDAHRSTLDQLEREHRVGRELVLKLETAKNRFLKKEGFRALDVAYALDALVSFYPKHIDLEDLHFFVPIMDYFDASERDAMLNAMKEFDQKLLNDLYEELLMKWESPQPPEPPMLELTGPVETFSCLFCGYTFDPRKGDPKAGIAPGTTFEALPESWLCPLCHVGKKLFLKNPVVGA